MPTSEPRRARVPGDKSITHRALIGAALATGSSHIRGALDAADTRSSAAVLRQLGVSLTAAGPGEFRVEGAGLRSLRPPQDQLDCGNSGTTARLLLGVLAAQPLAATLTGDDSLRSRPMRRVTDPLRRMGARVRELGEADRLPIEITGGALHALEYASPHASAQVKSALLLAGLTGGVQVTVTEPLRSRDHTERLLRALGVPIWEDDAEGAHRVRLSPIASLPALDLTVPGDFSAAAFLLAAGLLLPGVLLLEGVGVNPTRTGLLPVLARMGARIELLEPRELDGEPVADLLVTRTLLRGTTVEGTEVPAMIDEVPALAALAVRAEGETAVTGAGELRVKESDRIALLVANLRAIGVAAEELPDGLVVCGTPARLRGVVRTAGDHRIAMAFGVLAALPGSEITIDDPTATGVSFPGFWDTLRALGTAP